MILLVGSGRALGIVFWLRPNTQMTLGRKDAAIVIDGDHSVSRKHAVLIGGSSPESEEISVADTGSKFGVHINGSRIAHGETRTACTGDSIHFGAQGTIFTVRSVRVSLYLSKMRIDSAQQTANIAKTIGFEVVDNVTESTHVVMPAVSATRTLLRALVLGHFIAGPDFVLKAAALESVFRIKDATDEEIDRRIKNLGFLPPLHTPPMADDNPVCLDAGTLYPHTGRRNLFASKMFVFADEAQHNHLCELISDAGGQSCMLIDADQVHELTLKFGSVCLVLPQDSCNKSEIASASAAAPVIDKVRKIANILDQRPISESEISLSIIAASVAEHTNSAPREIEQVLSSANTEVVSTVRSRRRAAPRISNFWSSMIASNADVSQPTQKTDIACNEATVPETQSETQNAEQPVSSQLMQSPALDHAHGHDSSECRISTKELPGEVDKKPNLADLKNADNDISEPGGIQQQMSRICVIPVPLIKAKQSHQSAETVGTDGLGEPELSSTVPNFKRFKKTVHLY